MPSLFRRTALAAFLLLSSPACVTFTHPASGPDSLATQKAKLEGPGGFLALTASFDLKTFTTYPSVEIEITDDNGAIVTLKIGADDLLAFPKAQETVPLVFTVPVGTYKITRTLMNIPGGYVNGHHFDPSEHILSVEKELQPFRIDDGKVTHLAVIKFAMTESTSAKYLYYYSQTTVDPTRPDPKVWAPYQVFLTKTPGTYLKKTQLRTFTWPVWTLAANAKDDDEGAKIKGGKMLAPAVIQKVTQSKRGDVGACHLHYSPKATGRIEISYIIQPDGKVKEAKLTSSTLDAPKTEGCILGIVRKLKFPKTPDDDFETWSLTWDFNAAK